MKAMKTLLLLGVLLFGFTVSAQSQKVSLDLRMRGWKKYWHLLKARLV